MGDGDKFDIQGQVKGFPQKKKGKKGIYWNIETTVGKVNLQQDEEPVFQENKIYRFSGAVSEFENDKGETIKMKWVNEFGLVGETTTVNSHEKAHTTQKTTTSELVPQAMNGAALGNRLTNATLIVVAQIDKGAVKTDNQSIETALEYWNQLFKKYQETGEIGIPF